jgi:CRP-like cAMP-binding protein
MNAITAESLLQYNFLFRGLPPSVIASVAALATRRKFARGTVIFSQGDKADALYGVVAGRVRISASGAQGREVFLSLMEPGDTFGEIAVMDGLPRTATATVVEAATLVLIQKDDFLQLLAEQPQLSIHLLRLLCQRLRWTSELVEESAFLDATERLAKRLLILATLHGRTGPDGQIELRISQDELARFLGSSRQIVNQHLREWQRHEWVELRRGRITIIDPAQLRALASPA